MTASPSEKRLTGRAVLITLLIFFGIVISVNMVMMKLAIDTLSGTEVDSAYRASLAFKSEIAAAREQERRGWQIDAHVERSANGVAIVAIEARDREGVPLFGVEFTARLTRPTDKRADRKIALARPTTGTFRGTETGVEPGQWDLVIEAEGPAGRLYLSTTRIVLN